MGKQNFIAGELTKKEKGLYLGNAASNFAVTTEFMRKVTNIHQSGRVHLLCFVVALVCVGLFINF